MAAAAHHRFGLRHRLPHFGLRIGFDRQGVDDPRRIDEAPQRGAGRRDGELVERQPEEVALLLHHADDAVGMSKIFTSRPIGSWPSNSFSAKSCPITTTGTPARTSCPVKARPASIVSERISK